MSRKSKMTAAAAAAATAAASASAGGGGGCIIRNPHAFDGLSKEERFLLFVVPALGAARAARCFILDKEKVEAAWREFSTNPLPVHLE